MAEQFKIPEVDEIMNKFKLSCPVKKINMTLEQPNCIAGMWLISKENSEKEVQEKADFSDLTDDTILFFTNQHIVEICNILYGMLSLFKQNNIITEHDVDKCIRDLINFCHSVPSYFMLKEYVDQIPNKYLDFLKCPIALLSKFCNIMKDIWFVPYNELDKFAQEGIDSFKASIGENKNE